MLIFSSVFTSDKNYTFFKLFYESYSRAIDYLKSRMKCDNILGVIDFSDDFNDQPEKYEKLSGDWWEWAPGKGFCQNFNYCKSHVINMDAEYYFCFNDDIILNEEFIYNAITRMIYCKQPIGFLGGTSQIGGWLEDIENIRVPDPVDKIINIFSIARLHWEFSACGFPIEVLKKIGDMDTLFSPRLGLVSDNDYLHRIRKLGYSTVRDHNCTFWHSKARTQSWLRDPWGRDPHMIRASQVMKLKWNASLDPNVNNKPFDVPWDGRKLTIINDNTIKLDDQIIQLEKV